MRAWTILEQIVEDPVTNMRLEFSSIHTDELNAGNEAPGNDETVVLRLWTTDRARMATFRFQRSGGFLGTDIDYGNDPAGAPPPKPAEDLGANTGVLSGGNKMTVPELRAGVEATQAFLGKGAPGHLSPEDVWKEDPELAAMLGLAKPATFG